MAIYAPGRRDRHNRPLKEGGRSIVAMLSLTAMVDMFTVLAVFLLQNYNVTGEVIEIPDKVELPKAQQVKELQPAHVVVIDRAHVSLDKDVVADFVKVKEQQDWMIDGLSLKLRTVFAEDEKKRRAQALGNLKDVVDNNRGTPHDPADDRRVTVQAHKTIDVLTVKKVMYTLQESGASEINFAVMKDEGNTAM